MTLYFTASIAGKKQYIKNYLTIIDYLNSIGHSVISDHIIKTSEKDLRTEEKEALIAFQKQLETWIAESDCVIAEASYPSISVGYEISLAQNMGKPILILYTDATKPPTLLTYHKDENIICEQYTSEILRELIDDFLNYVKGASDSRFTFFITSKIASYLEKISKKEKLPKSVYLRRLIEADMDKRT